MLLKIETYSYNPPVDASLQHEPLVKGNKFKVFHIIDHVEDVKFGTYTFFNEASMHHRVSENGIVTEVEILMDDGGPNKSAESFMLNLIYFRQGGRQDRIIAAAGNVYLCNDEGDTLEIIRSLN